MEANYVVLVIYTLLISGVIYLLVRYPKVREFVPFVAWLARAVRVSLDHWGFKKSYGESIDLSIRSLGLAYALSLEGTDLREARERVGTFVAAAYVNAYPDTIEYKRAKSVATAGYMAVLSYPDIAQTIKGLQDHENLDVRKATYVVIDILGELLDRSDKLSQEYFQHIVYGLNKCLVLFKKGGHDRKTTLSIYATLWRMYQLTKAFNKLKAGEGLTKKEFYEKITFIIDSMLHLLSSE